MRSIALASVAVPTVDRGSAPRRCWSTMIAVVRPSSTSTSGRASVGMKPCTNALYVSLISRCDSAAIVSNTRELLPEPETPVKTVSRRFGISMLTSLRLFTRAPCTRIRFCRSAACGAASPVAALAAPDFAVPARAAPDFAVPAFAAPDFAAAPPVPVLAAPDFAAAALPVPVPAVPVLAVSVLRALAIVSPSAGRAGT